MSCSKRSRTSRAWSRGSGLQRCGLRSGATRDCWRNTPAATRTIGSTSSTSGVAGMAMTGVTDGFRRLARTAVAQLLPVGALLLFAGGPYALAADSDLDRLMGALAQRKHGHVTFVEKKYIALLDKP